MRTAIITGCIMVITAQAVVTMVEAVQLHALGVRAEAVLTRVKLQKHLPSECRPFYNDGTDRWIECMGVGKK